MQELQVRTDDILKLSGVSCLSQPTHITAQIYAQITVAVLETNNMQL